MHGGAGEQVSQPTRIWRNARLATLAAGQPGLGIVEHGAIAARDGRIVYAGPETELPAALRRQAPKSSTAKAAGSRPA